VIEVDRVQAAFGAFTLGELSLRLQAGEYWVLLGPSGSGKSLLLHTIAGIRRPDAGRVRVDGVDVTHLGPEARRVGLVFQQSALFPHMSVTANVEYALRVRGVPAEERQQRRVELVESIGLAPVLERPVATLSGGEAQKVALARALASNPSVLLLDEPLGPIDTNARVELQALLKSVQGSGSLATLHVTHDREEARALGDHCAVMFNGQIAQAGKTAELFAEPASDSVAQFLGL
jgi:ABC-type Fe3+/spermidine/putrescine transport system ATPase subunit